MPQPPSKNGAVILLILKAPVPGQVKTRLAADIGAQAATDLYRALVESQLERLPHECSLEVHFAPADAGPLFCRWLGDALDYHPQFDGDLGERLQHAVNGAFGRGAREVICIGADCPSLLPSHFDEAVEQLRSPESDLVIGPSKDGGYYLIGLRQPADKLFQNIRWSSAHTLSDTLAKAREAQLKIHTLETMEDIDVIEDLRSAVRSGYLPPTYLPSFPSPPPS